MHAINAYQVAVEKQKSARKFFPACLLAIVHEIAVNQ